MDRAQTGAKGEALAADYLIAHGHSILERNCRKGHLEIDLITLDDAGIHFVEVKSRTVPLQAPPQMSVGPVKQKRLVNAALRWLHGASDPRLQKHAEVQFDIIAVTFDGPTTAIEYIPQAFIPIYT